MKVGYQIEGNFPHTVVAGSYDIRSRKVYATEELAFEAAERFLKEYLPTHISASSHPSFERRVLSISFSRTFPLLVAEMRIEVRTAKQVHKQEKKEIDGRIYRRNYSEMVYGDWKDNWHERSSVAIREVSFEVITELEE